MSIFVKSIAKRAPGFLVSGLLLTGCTLPMQTEHISSSPIAVSPAIPQSPRRATIDGSLWEDSGSSQNLFFLDSRARNVNDLLTVIISENPTADQTANTKTARKSNPSASISQVLGLDFTKDNLGGILGRPPTISASMNNAFDGSGSTDRSGKVLATLSARVLEVLPNGNLVIEGRREITINRETQFITISGVVRPTDIDKDNTVQSAKLSDARISYTGKGVLADQQGPGWLSRILDKVWPF